MFEGFDDRRVDGIALVSAGDGPPVLLLHGYPQTHHLWRHVAPALVTAGHTVVCPDLRGYGASHKPPAGPDSEAYSKRAMAAELVAVMASLGHERFAVAGHDRGGRVAYRMALDHPDRVTRLATLDVMTTLDQWESIRGVGSVSGFHWQFLAQKAPFPERFIGTDPEYWLRTLCGGWAAGAAAMEDAMEHYLAAFADPETIRATCDDYRAGAGIDVAIDQADREAGRTISCPMLALWGDPTGRRPSLLDRWRPWAPQVEGWGLPCGHFLPEEAPAETADALRTFFAP